MRQGMRARKGEEKICKSIILMTLLICGLGLSYGSTQEMVGEPEGSENEYQGFAIEWEDGNLSDFVRQVENAVGFNFNLSSVSLFGLNSDSSKDTSVDPHSYHRTDLAVADTTDTSSVSVKDDHSYQKETPDSTDSLYATETQQDWRETRKWWQRGGPVL